MPKLEIQCSGTRACDSEPVEMPDQKGWEVWLPAYNLYCGKAGYHVILSPLVNRDSLITWAGPLGCFPTESPLNQAVKIKLIKENGERAFFAAVCNPEGSHLAQLVLNIDENLGCINYVCGGCPKFSSFKEK